MTYEQYWEQDATLAIYYRKADELRKERINQSAWLQGLYIYDALARLAPLFNSNVKKGTKPKPYVEEAYPISRRGVEEAREKKEKAKAEKGLLYMQTYMSQKSKKTKSAEER